jgi:hypothetical protein
MLVEHQVVVALGQRDEDAGRGEAHQARVVQSMA